jgi:chemotaxis protein MotB
MRSMVRCATERGAPLGSCEEATSKLKAELAGLRSKLDEQDRALQINKAELEQKDTEIKRALAHIDSESASHARLSSVLADNTSLASRNTFLSEENANLRANVAYLSEQRASHEASLSALRAQLVTAMSMHAIEIKAAQDRYTEIEARAAALTGERDALTAERDALTAEREALTAEREALTAEREALTAELSVSVQKAELLTQKLKQAAIDLAALESEKAKLHAESVATTGKLEAHQAELSEKTRGMAEIVSKLETLNKDAHQAREREAGYATEKAHLVAKQDELSKRIDASKHELNQLMQQSGKQTSDSAEQITALVTLSESHRTAESELRTKVSMLDAGLKEEEERRRVVDAKQTRYLDTLKARGRKWKESKRALSATSDAHNAHIDAMARDIEQKQSEISRMKRAHSALADRLLVAERGTEEVSALGKQVDTLTRELKLKTSETDELKRKSTEATHAHTTAMETTTILDGQIEQLRAQMTELKNKTSASALAQERTLKAQLAATALCASNAATLRAELATAKKQAEDSRADVNRIVAQTVSKTQVTTAALNAAAAKSGALDRRVAELDAIIAIKDAEIASHRAQEADAQEQIRKAKEEATVYESQIASEKATLQAESALLRLDQTRERTLAQQAIDNAQKRIEDLQEEHTKIVGALRGEQLRTKQLESESAAMSEKLSAVATALRAAESASTASHDREVATARNLEMSQAALSDNTRSMKEIVSQLDALKKEALLASDREAGYATEREGLVAKQDELGKKIDASTRQLNELRQQSGKQTSSRDKKIAALMTLNEQLRTANAKLSTKVSILDASIEEETKMRRVLDANQKKYLDTLQARGREWKKSKQALSAESDAHKKHIHTIERDIEKKQIEISRMERAHSELESRLLVAERGTEEASDLMKRVGKLTRELNQKEIDTTATILLLQTATDAHRTAMETNKILDGQIAQLRAQMAELKNTTDASALAQERTLKAQLAATALCESNAATLRAELATAKKQAEDSRADVSRIVAQTISKTQVTTAALNAAAAKSGALDRRVVELSASLASTQKEIAAHKTNEASALAQVLKAEEEAKAYVLQITGLKYEVSDLAGQLIKVMDETDRKVGPIVHVGRPVTPERPPHSVLTTDGSLDVEKALSVIQKGVNPRELTSIILAMPDHTLHTIITSGDIYREAAVERATLVKNAREIQLRLKDERGRGVSIKDRQLEHEQQATELKTDRDNVKTKHETSSSATRTETSEARIAELSDQITTLNSEKSGLVSTMETLRASHATQIEGMNGAIVQLKGYVDQIELQLQAVRRTVESATTSNTAAQALVAALTYERSKFRSLCADGNQTTDECVHDLEQMKRVFTEDLTQTSTGEGRGPRTKVSMQSMLVSHIREKVRLDTLKLERSEDKLRIEATQAQNAQRIAENQLKAVRSANLKLESTIRQVDTNLKETTYANTKRTNDLTAANKLCEAEKSALGLVNSETNRRLQESTRLVADKDALLPIATAAIASLEETLRQKREEYDTLVETDKEKDTTISTLTTAADAFKRGMGSLESRIETKDVKITRLELLLRESSKEIIALNETHGELTNDNRDLAEVAETLRNQINRSDKDLQVIIDNYTTRFVEFHISVIDDALQKAEVALVDEQTAAEHKIKKELRKEHTMAISTATDQLETDHQTKLTTLRDQLEKDHTTKLTALSELYLSKIKAAHAALLALILPTDQRAALKTNLQGIMIKDVANEFKLTVDQPRRKPKTNGRSSTPNGADLIEARVIEAPVGALKLADTLDELKRRIMDMRWVRGVTSLIDIKNYVDRFQFSAKDQMVLRACAAYIEEPDQALRSVIIHDILRPFTQTSGKIMEPTQDTGTAGSPGKVTLVSYIAGLRPNEDDSRGITEHDVRRLLRMEAIDPVLQEPRVDKATGFGRFI